MAELLRIQEPARAPRAKASLQAFLGLAFRPLYLAGCGWAAIAIGLWVFAPQWIAQPLLGIAWHAHEMLWGFIATIAVGFLLTAGANWTGINPLHGKPLAGLCMLWLAARLGFLAGGRTLFFLAAACELAFFILAAAALLRAVHKSRNQRNYGVPWMLLALGAADALYLKAALAGDYTLLMRRFDIGLICMAMIALLVARRVIPFFAMRAVAGLQIPMHTRSGQLQLATSAAALALAGLGLAGPMALMLALTGAISLAQVLAWKPWAVRRQPLLWILYVGYAMLGLGLLLAAAHSAGFVERRGLHVHVIAVGGFSVLIIGMVTRTALGHLGRPLAADRSMRASYGLMICALLLRLLALAPSAASPAALRLAGIAWLGALGLYLWRFAPILIRPRVDQAQQAPIIRGKPLQGHPTIRA